MRYRIGALFAILALIAATLYQANMAHSLYRAFVPHLHRLPVYNKCLPLVTSVASRFNSVITSRPYLQSLTSKSFSSTSMASSKSFIDAVKSRRTFYALNKQAPISDDKIEELVNDTILHVPSSFNSQTTRCVVLLKDQHDKFWDFVMAVLKPLLTDEDQVKSTTQRVNGFRAGYGTILFFEDPHPVHELQTKLPLYADKFPEWSEHTSAMHQYVLWTALETEGFGCNLQHYNPLVDQLAQKEWKVPLEWRLKAQLVFGGRAAEPGPKTHKPLEERVFVHGK